MTYESWRISYQSSEQAAKAAYKYWQETLAHERQLKTVLADDLIRRSDFYEIAEKFSTKIHPFEYTAFMQAINTIPAISNTSVKDALEAAATFAEGATAYTQFQTVEHYKMAAYIAESIRALITDKKEG